MNDSNDLKIIRAFEDRSERAIAAVSERYGTLCLRIAAGILHDKRDCEECVNDAYMQLWRAIPPAQPKSLRAYLYTTVRNIALRKHRELHALKRNCELLDELDECCPSSDCTDEDFDAMLTAQTISDFLRGLPSSHRTVFIRRYYYCLTVSHIAELEGISEGTVKSILNRTRNKLKLELEKKGIET